MMPQLDDLWQTCDPMQTAQCHAQSLAPPPFPVCALFPTGCRWFCAVFFSLFFFSFFFFLLYLMYRCYLGHVWSCPWSFLRSLCSPALCLVFLVSKRAGRWVWLARLRLGFASVVGNVGASRGVEGRRGVFLVAKKGPVSPRRSIRRPQSRALPGETTGLRSPTARLDDKGRTKTEFKTRLRRQTSGATTPACTCI